VIVRSRLSLNVASAFVPASRDDEMSRSVEADREGARCRAPRSRRDWWAGSGITFQDRGEHTLKGVPDRAQLYAAT